MNLEWSGVGRGFEYAAAFVAVGGAVLLAIRLARKTWRYTLGQRRVQQDTVDQLACGSSRVFVDSLLGAPQFMTADDDLETSAYRLAGCWVSVVYRGNTVVSFSVTVTDRRLWIDATRLSHAQLSSPPVRWWSFSDAVQLGRTAIQQVDGGVDEASWVGARRTGHVRHYYFGNPGVYQHYWLSYNDAGAGSLIPEELEGAAVLRGRFGDSPPPSRSTANTLTVVADFKVVDRVTQEWRFGVDLDTVRLRAVD